MPPVKTAKVTNKQLKQERDRAIQQAIQGWQIPIMELATVSRAAEVAQEKGEDMVAAITTVLERVATRSVVAIRSR